MRTPEKLIASLSFQLRLNGLIKAASLAFSVYLLGTVFLLPLPLGILSAAGTFIYLAIFFKVLKDQRIKAIQILHRQFPSLEFSLELWDKKSRNMAEKLQWERLVDTFQLVKPPIIFLDRTLVFFITLLLSGIVVWFNNDAGDINPTEIISNGSVPKAVDGLSADLPLSTKEISVAITPPAYTRQKRQIQKELPIRAIKGSSISWEIGFNRKAELEVTLVNAGGGELPFRKKEDTYTLNDRLTGSGLYAIRAYEQDSLIFESEYHPLEMYEDLPPVILPHEQEIYRYHFVQDPKQYRLNAHISDDFLVTEAFLVATLASGSGENVRFREIRLRLDEGNFNKADLSKELDLVALDFKPGDELYYYWAAYDNQTPEPNFSRSDTYFIQFVDASGLDDTQLAGMAVNVLPEYFRSQRQIIIDTEKLIAERGKVEAETFNSTSNEIGFDQKLLRMRYGQYLGEEFESDAGGAAGHPEDADNILESFMHLHDQEDKEGQSLAPSDNNASGTKESLLPYLDEKHDHHSENEGDKDLNDLLEQYLHNHDSGEMNTYFEESTRALLKMALEQMWQSELHLRLFEPEKALPFQNKALEYLKSVQQKSRTYVRRTGFDPPPIREEEKRLSGELAELERDIEVKLLDNKDRLSPLAAQIIGLVQKENLSETDRQVVLEFSRLWAQRLQYTGVQDWSMLLLLQKANTSTLDEKEQHELVQKLLSLVQDGPRKNASPLMNKALEKAFWNNLR